ncbi:MAG: hypothetical protein R2737_05865 [Candidatus Nanopelagicales bacterium]
MGVVAAAIRLSEEAGGHEAGQVSPYVFGGFAFVALCLLLVVTMMVNVDN